MTIGSCGACGATLEPGAVFCGECGSRVSDHAASTRTPSAASPTAPSLAPAAQVGPAPAAPVGPAPAAPHIGAAHGPATGPVASPYGPVEPPPLVPAPPGPVPAPGAPARAGQPAPGAPWAVASDHAAPPPSRRASAAVPQRAALPVAVSPGAVAPVGRRVAAHAVDVVVTVVVAGAVAGATGGIADAATRPAALLPAQGAVLLLGLGQWLAESFTGATIGGAVLRIRTLSARTGRPAGPWRILLRDLVVGLGLLVCYVGQWVVVASGAWDRGTAQRGWHDKAAGTIVLRAGARGGSVPRDGAYASAVARAVGVPPGPAADAAAARPDAGAPGDVPASVPVASGEPGAPAAPAAAAVEPAVLPTTPSGAPAPVDPGAFVPVAPIPVPAFARDVSRRELRASTSAEGLITGPPTTGAQAPVAPAAPRRDEPVAADEAARGDAPVAPASDLGELEHTRLRPAAPAPAEPAAPAVALRLVFDTGERVDVVGDGVVGRDPGTAPGVVHVVAIDDPDRSVSKVHLAFGLDGPSDRLWVVDRGSTNGTVLVKPDGSRLVLPPGARASVSAGWTIRFGERAARVEPR